MEVLSKSSYIKMSPRKLRLVADTIRGLSSVQALAFLSQTGKKAARVLAKSLKTAIANAKNNFQLKEEDLKIKTIEINGGPISKRFRAISRGMAHPIAKRTSHIKIILESPDTKIEKAVENKNIKQGVTHGTKS